jgi:glycylpeptide N-tetradecanoyltransferase
LFDEKEKKVTDFCSFYSLPSSVLQNPKHAKMRAAYSFYNVATTVPLENLMHNALILANSEGYDVFNALNVMENEPLFKV